MIKQRYTVDVQRKKYEVDVVVKADNCGTGAGGFQPGNDCAAGDGSSSADKPKAKIEQDKKEYIEKQKQAIEEKEKEKNPLVEQAQVLRDEYEQLRHEHGSSDDSRVKEALKKSNDAFDQLRKVEKDINTLERDVSILEAAKTLDVNQSVSIAEGVDVDPVVAQAIIDTALFKPYMDASEQNAERYNYKLVEIDRQASNAVYYEFEATHKEKISSVPKNTIDEIPEREGYVYRGMSNEEWELSKSRGYLQSFGDLNITDGQKGLTFYGGPKTAELYANGFTHPEFKPTPSKPSVVVEIPKSLVMDHTESESIPQGEFAHRGSVPLSKINTRYELHPEKQNNGMVRVMFNGEKLVQSGGRNPGVSHVVVVAEEAKQKKYTLEIKADNCGTGAGGFQAGNDCAAGDGSSSASDRRTGKVTKEEQDNFKYWMEFEDRQANSDEPTDRETWEGHRWEGINEDEQMEWEVEGNKGLVQGSFQGKPFYKIDPSLINRIADSTTQNAGGVELLEKSAQFYTDKGDGIVNSYLRQGVTRDAKRMRQISEGIDADKAVKDAAGLATSNKFEDVVAFRKEHIKDSADFLTSAFDFADNMQVNWNEKGSKEFNKSLAQLKSAANQTNIAERAFTEAVLGPGSEAQISQYATFAADYAAKAKKTKVLLESTANLADGIAKSKAAQLDRVANGMLDNGNEVTVYRGIAIQNAKDKRVYDQIMSGKNKYKMPSFGSTSLDRETARYFAKSDGGSAEASIMFKIKTKKGGYIDEYSHHGGEYEVLLPRDSVYTIESKQLRRDESNHLYLLVEMTREDRSEQ